MNKSPNQNHKKTRTAEIASTNGRVKALTRLLRCATVLRVTPPTRYG